MLNESTTSKDQKKINLAGQLNKIKLRINGNYFSLIQVLFRTLKRRN